MSTGIYTIIGYLGGLVLVLVSVQHDVYLRTGIFPLGFTMKLSFIQLQTSDTGKKIHWTTKMTLDTR